MISRSIFAVVLLAARALAGPPLTTIQDVLYKADGTRFNGILTIAWTSFQAPDSSQIATQTTTVRVVDGNLYVQLVPTTTSSPAVYYAVTYNSDGRIQFNETWAVPSSTRSLRVRDVRISLSNDTADPPAGDTIPINEANVIGLVDDLEARPLKGPGYAAGRVAVVNASGLLESISGSPADCVRVDGSSGPCGQPASFVDGDVPAGIVDGANTVFTLSAAPAPASSLAVYRNGLLQKIGQDYTLTVGTVRFAAGAVPQAGDTLLASYRLSGDVASPPQQAYPSPQVVCSGTGAATVGIDLTSIGTCTIPAGLLQAGDRVEVRYDLEHQGTTSGFSFEIHWGATTVSHRDAAVSDGLVTGRADAGITAAGAQLSFQSWGAVLPFNAGVAASTDAWAGGVTIDFQGKLAAAGDTLTLRNYTVVRFP